MIPIEALFEKLQNQRIAKLEVDMTDLQKIVNRPIISINFYKQT
jgi:hypothetical protein